MKTVTRAGRDGRRGFSLGTGLGLAVLALAPLAAGIAMLGARHVTLRDMAAAQSWRATPCTIERSAFVLDDDGRWLDFAYSYTVAGQTHTTTRLDLVVGRFGDDDMFEEAIQADHPPGSTATCYVDPADPRRAVFDRNHGAAAPRRMWLLAFPFVFVGLVFSLGLLTATLGGGKPHAQQQPAPPEPEPPPRRTGWAAWLAIAAGPASSQLAWLFLVGFVYVFILLDGPACWARLFSWPGASAQVLGRVTDVRALDEREFSTTLHQYTLAYEVAGTPYTTTCYTRGRPHETGAEVPVRYDPDKPAQALMVGARPSNFTWWHSSIPLGVALLLLLGLGGMLVHGVRTAWLLRHGAVAHAHRHAARAPTDDEPPDGPPSMLSAFAFDVDGRTCIARRYAPGRLRGRRDADRGAEHVLVLYDPRRPERNVALDGALAATLAGARSPLGWIAQCLAGPFCLAALAALFWNSAS